MYQSGYLCSKGRLVPVNSPRPHMEKRVPARLPACKYDPSLAVAGPYTRFKRSWYGPSELLVRMCRLRHQKERPRDSRAMYHVCRYETAEAELSGRIPVRVATNDVQTPYQLSITVPTTLSATPVRKTRCSMPDTEPVLAPARQSTVTGQSLATPWSGNPYGSGPVVGRPYTEAIQGKARSTRGLAPYMRPRAEARKRGSQVRIPTNCRHRPDFPLPHAGQG